MPTAKFQPCTWWRKSLYYR